MMNRHIVMAGLVPAIHVFDAVPIKGVMPAQAGMTHADAAMAE
jgi:hypothetical protein